MFSSLYS
ncbi:hypothetical protein CP061683_0702A, partial [Chlamydia psittaci 06-1683]